MAMFEIIDGLHTNRIKLPINDLSIDLGCGKITKEGCVGMDKIDFGQDIVWDLDMGIPVPDRSVKYVHMSHFVEHLDAKQIDLLWGELARVCQDDAVIEARCPYSGHPSAYLACHYSLWHEDRVIGLCQGDLGCGNFSIVDLRHDQYELFFTLKFHI